VLGALPPGALDPAVVSGRIEVMVPGAVVPGAVAPGALHPAVVSGRMEVKMVERERERERERARANKGATRPHTHTLHINEHLVPSQRHPW
jgi:hypothetical protein